MRIDQLSYIHTLSKYRSLSQAAEALYINQPTLSRALTALEKELGITLFDRSYQGIQLTTIGRKMLPHFENILLEIEQVQALSLIHIWQGHQGGLHHGPHYPTGRCDADNGSIGWRTDAGSV